MDSRVRIVDVSENSFSYETLEGHAEIGRANFRLTQEDNFIIPEIHTFSKPNNIFAKIFNKLITDPYQDYAAKRVVENLSNWLKMNIGIDK